MSDNVPFDIQKEIIKMLPVKSLIRFRSISKSWKSLIDSSDFVANYTSQRQHLLIRYARRPGYDSYEEKYVSVVDDDGFPHQTVTLTLPLLVKLVRDKRYSIIGSSYGLLCFYGWYDDVTVRYGYMDDRGLAVIWNPSVRKAVAVVVPVSDGEVYVTELGFGVCPETKDVKLVNITYINWSVDVERVTCIPWQVEVFTLSTGTWRSPYGNLPRKSIYFGSKQSVVDGVCYWLATDRSTVDVGIEAYNMIVSFDMTSEVFSEVNLPDNFVYMGSVHSMYISNLKESLVVLEHNVREQSFVVWLMEDGVPKSFTKLYTIHAPLLQKVLVFRKSGEPVIEVVEKVVEDEYGRGYGLSSLLAVYDPNSKHICDLGFDGVGNYFVCSYMETLLLHDQPSFTMFDKGKRQTLH